MNFTDKYISEKENSETLDTKKILLSNDAFAIGDMINELIIKLENVRASFIK